MHLELRDAVMQQLIARPTEPAVSSYQQLGFDRSRLIQQVNFNAIILEQK